MPMITAFANLGELKRRLRITDTTEDTVLLEFLRGAAADIEAAAGRPLRRRHRVTEYFRGGRDTIRLGMAPVARIHSVRESDTRDFGESAAYTELMEDTDFVLETTNDGAPAGRRAVLRRIGQTWLGNKANPKKIQVVYTGGFKTDQELAAENDEFSIEEAGETIDYAVESINNVGTGIINTEDPDIILTPTSTISRNGLLRFNVENALLPVWTISQAALRLAARTNATPGSVRVHSVRVDPILQGDLTLLANAATQGAAEFISTLDFNSAAYATQTLPIDSTLPDFAAIVQNMIETVRTGKFVAFSLAAVNVVPGVHTLEWASSENGSAALKPKLTVRHGLTFFDEFTVPDDLREANMIEAVHRYKTRNAPGLKSEAARGVAIASGVSRQFTNLELLPQVGAVARTYRRLY